MIHVRPLGLNAIHCVLCERNEREVVAMVQGVRANAGVCLDCASVSIGKMMNTVRRRGQLDCHDHDQSKGTKP